MSYNSSILENNKKFIFNAGLESVFAYADNKTEYSPKISLIFSPFGLPFIPIEILGTGVNEVVTALSWSKDRNNPGGVCQVEISPDKDTIFSIYDIINQQVSNFFSKAWDAIGFELEDLIKPMTLCQLWIDGYMVMTGTVRSCMRHSSVENNGKSVSYSVVLDELGNLYNMNTLSLDTIILDGMQSQITDSLKKAMELAATQKGVTLGVGIKAIIDAFLLTTLEQGINMSDGFPLAYRLLATTNPFGGIANSSFANAMTIDSNLFQLKSMSNSQSSIWSFLKNLIPSPWMEFFTESGGRTFVTDGFGVPSFSFPGFNYIVARSVPYSNPLIGYVNPVHVPTILPYDLTALQMLIGGDYVIIHDDIITEKSLGVDCVNQKTIFQTGYTNNGVVAAQDFNNRPVKSIGPLNPLASGGVATFGSREMFQNIDSTSLKGLGSSESYVERIAKNTFGLPFKMLSKPALNNLLAVWYRNQSRFREGTVTLKGMPYARVGMYCMYLPPIFANRKAENPRDIGLYYIDSLSHNYTLSEDGINFTTTLNLIRGVPLPMSLMAAAILLFDFEILPPQTNLSDNETAGELAAKAAARLL